MARGAGWRRFGSFGMLKSIIEQNWSKNKFLMIKTLFFQSINDRLIV
jgi:hypothetical protein